MYKKNNKYIDNIDKSNRISFLEEQCISLQNIIQYQKYHLPKKEKEVINLLLKLAPSKLRSIQSIMDLHNSKFSWISIFFRHPLKIYLWMTAKRLK